MAFCRNCGAPLKSGTRYCTSCGSPIPEGDMAAYDPNVQGEEKTIDYAQQAGTSSTQVYYSTPPPVQPKKNKHILAGIVIGIVIIGLIIAVSTFVLLGMDTDLKPTLEYDSGFQEVVCEDKGGYLVYTPVMKDGFIFDHWILPDGSIYKDKILTMTKGTGTIKGYSTEGYTVTVYTMYGISVSGDGDYKKGTTAKIEVGDDVAKYKGLYSIDGTLLADEHTTTYIVPEKTNVTIIASSDTTRYKGDSSLKADLNGTGIIASTSYWYVMDGGVLVYATNGYSNINLAINPGIYDVITVGKNSAGDTVNKTVTKEVTGTYKLKYSWEYKSDSYEVTWTVQYDTYKQSKDKSVDRAPSTSSERSSYVTTALPDSTVVDYLKNQATSKSMTETERANFVLKFVQRCFWYQTDYSYNGNTEYWKYPLETMVDQRGDCEDTAILYCNLMREIGHDTALLLYEGEYYEGRGHVASGLNVSENIPGGYYYTEDSTKYYYCETTSKTYVVGQLWDEYGDHCNIITIPGKT